MKFSDFCKTDLAAKMVFDGGEYGRNCGLLGAWAFIEAWENGDISEEQKRQLLDSESGYSGGEALTDSGVSLDDLVDSCLPDYAATEDWQRIVNDLDYFYGDSYAPVLEFWDEGDDSPIGALNPNTYQLIARASVMTSRAVEAGIDAGMTHFINTSYYEAATKLGMV